VEPGHLQVSQQNALQPEHTGWTFVNALRVEMRLRHTNTVATGADLGSVG
jgi:hypothetical protein